MSLSEAIQKVFDFLSEYRQESATLPVSEQQMDTFKEMFSGREVKSRIHCCFKKKEKRKNIT